MTDTLDYEYDVEGYEAKVQKLLQRSRNNTAKLKKPSYEDLEKLQKEDRRIKRQLKDLINELEVEDFLMFGPKGKDPD